MGILTRWTAVTATAALVTTGCSDDPTGPSTIEVPGFELLVRHEFHHVGSGGVNVVPYFRLDAPVGSDPSELADADLLVVDIPGRGTRQMTPTFEEIDGRLSMSFRGSTRAEPVPSGPYVGRLEFQSSPESWRFTGELTPAPLDAAVLETSTLTDDEIELTWTAPAAPHSWHLELYRRVLVDGFHQDELVSTGPATQVSAGGTLAGSISLEPIEPGEEFVAHLVLSDDETLHHHPILGVRPEPTG